MLYQQTLFIVTAFLTAVVVHSLPSPPPDKELKVIRQYEAAEGGYLTWYGEQTPAKRSSNTTVDECGPPAVTCSNNSVYLAYQSDCFGLHSVLLGQQSNGTVTRTELSAVSRIPASVASA